VARRWTYEKVFLACLIVAAAGVVTGNPATASPPALQACTANSLNVSAQQLGQVRGQSLKAFKLKNTGSSTCGLEGYPNLQFFTASRLDTRVKVVHHSSVYVAVRSKLLTITPNETVSFGVSYRSTSLTSNGAPKRCLVESILIQLPLAPVSSGEFAYHGPFNACTARYVVAVTPVERSALPQRTH
jgi:uncharacterized protein DUF4232